MNILILGGTGSIGSALINILKCSDHRVYVTSRTARQNNKNIRYIEGNAHDETFLLKCVGLEKWDAIIDFMAYSTRVFSNRVNIFLNATEQYFFLSSSRVYAESGNLITEDSPRILDICEDEEYLYTDEYALAKARQEDLLISSGKKNWTIIRPYKTYNNNRFQFGMFEKEDWLYRVMMGKTLLFPCDMAERRTTLTYAGDVAVAINELIGNPHAYGESFHITTTESITWRKVFEKYSEIVLKQTGFSCSIKYWDQIEDFYEVCNQYQIKYDCIYDRRFDNSKINKVTNNAIQYTSFSEGCEKCLFDFIRNPIWRSVNWKLNFWMDSLLNEKISFWDVIGYKEKLRYLKFRAKI